MSSENNWHLTYTSAFARLRQHLSEFHIFQASLRPISEAGIPKGHQHRPAINSTVAKILLCNIGVYYIV